MKLLFFLLFFVLLSSNVANATRLPVRLLTPEDGKAELMINEFSQVSYSSEMDEEDPWIQMGFEDCASGDGDCFRRRMASQVHLDYIYTQPHKP